MQMCKSTFNAIINIKKILMEEQIIAQGKNDQIYSLQVDSVQDVSSLDQFSIVIPCVFNAKIHDRLLSII